DPVAQIVNLCKNAEASHTLPIKGRKANYTDRLSHASPSILLVSAADNLHNARAILGDYRALGENLWDRFNGGKEGTLWYYKSLVDAFKQAAAGTALAPLIGELERVVGEIEKLSA